MSPQTILRTEEVKEQLKTGHVPQTDLNFKCLLVICVHSPLCLLCFIYSVLQDSVSRETQSNKNQTSRTETVWDSG